MIDPNTMNKHLDGNEEKNDKRYKRVTKVNEPAFDADDFEMDYDPNEAVDFNPNENTPERVSINNPQHSEDEEVLPGLYNSDILSFKKQFGDVFFAEIKGQPFVFRPLERYEYKEIISTPNTDPLMREEMICEYCVLYPQSYDFSQMANQKAGYPAVLSELIMDHSGFTREVQVRKL